MVTTFAKMKYNSITIEYLFLKTGYLLIYKNGTFIKARTKQWRSRHQHYF